jgi:membrane protein required for colicin V production
VLWIDSVIMAIVAICAVTGIVRGLLGEMLSLAGRLIAIGTGLMFNQEFSMLLAISVTNPAVKIALSFTDLAVITLLMTNTINALLLEGSINNPLGFFNRFWAMILGSLHGVLIIAILVLLAGLSPLPSETWWKDALLIPPFQSLAVFIKESIPTEIAAYINYR